MTNAGGIPAGMPQPMGIPRQTPGILRRKGAGPDDVLRILQELRYRGDCQRAEAPVSEDPQLSLPALRRGVFQL